MRRSSDLRRFGWRRAPRRRGAWWVAIAAYVVAWPAAAQPDAGGGAPEDPSTRAGLRAEPAPAELAQCGGIAGCAEHGFDVVEPLAHLTREVLELDSTPSFYAGYELKRAAQALLRHAEADLARGPAEAVRATSLVAAMARRVLAPVVRELAGEHLRDAAYALLAGDELAGVVRVLDLAGRSGFGEVRDEATVAARELAATLGSTLAALRVAPEARRDRPVTQAMRSLTARIGAALVASPQPTEVALELGRASAPLSWIALAAGPAARTDPLLRALTGRRTVPAEGWRAWIARRGPLEECGAVPVPPHGVVVLERPWHDDVCWVVRAFDARRRVERGAWALEAHPDGFVLVPSKPRSARVLFHGRYQFQLLDVARLRLSAPFAPPFCGIGEDSQSGMVKVERFDGRWIAGNMVDSGPFTIDVANPQRPKPDRSCPVE